MNRLDLQTRRQIVAALVEGCGSRPEASRQGSASIIRAFSMAELGHRGRPRGRLKQAQYH